MVRRAHSEVVTFKLGFSEKKETDTLQSKGEKHLMLKEWRVQRPGGAKGHKHVNKEIMCLV